MNRIRRTLAALGVAAALAFTAGTAGQVAAAGLTSDSRAEAYTDYYNARCVYHHSDWGGGKWWNGVYYPRYEIRKWYSVQLWRDYNWYEESVLGYRDHYIHYAYVNYC